MQILSGILLGMAAGLWLGREAAPLGQIGTLVIQLVKLFAVPLLLFAILDAFLETDIGGRAAGRMIGITSINTAIALLIGLGLSNWLEPGRHLTLPAITGPTPAPPGRIEFLKTISGYIPSNFVDPFRENLVITIILLAVAVGLALRAVKREQIARGQTRYRAVEDFVASAFRATEIVLGWVIRLIPFAVFGVVAKTIGEQGFAPLKGLAVYVGVALLGLAVHVFITYQAWIVLVARMPLRQFWRGARDPVLYAMGAASSLATLPVTLNALNRMKVSPESARLAACVGTNLNNDGILLYEAMAVLFVAQVHGLDLTVGQQLVAAFGCIVAGVGISGIPDAGLISLSLVLTTVGLPVEIVPLLFTVDWLIGRTRAMTNVISDMLVAVLLDRTASR
ncbi:MAG TPA: dicarboxylate/amino acid:cation symporter [Vicinamibacterales bacterium]|nr:dicarboxylate/amino acid:cation symporter [Vicinamibacterales bacterium]